MSNQCELALFAQHFTLLDIRAQVKCQAITVLHGLDDWELCVDTCATGCYRSSVAVAVVERAATGQGALSSTGTGGRPSIAGLIGETGLLILISIKFDDDPVL